MSKEFTRKKLTFSRYFTTIRILCSLTFIICIIIFGYFRFSDRENIAWEILFFGSITGFSFCMGYVLAEYHNDLIKIRNQPFTDMSNDIPEDFKSAINLAKSSIKDTKKFFRSESNKFRRYH